MKKLIIILALTVWNTGIYAQKVFDEAVFNGMMSRLQTDPAFFKNEVDPSFIITFGNGATTNQESMLKYAENNIGLYKPKYSNLKVSQYGNTGIVTGTNEETFLSKANPSIVTRTSKHLFTYTFAKIKSNWIWVAGQHTDIPTPFTKETLNEILAEYKADSKEFMNNHLSENFRYINNRGGFQPRKDFIGGNKQSIVTTEMLEPVILQSGNLAVTSGIHKTLRTTSDGKQEIGQVGATYTWQNIGGKWMFVGSQQVTKPSENDEQVIKDLLMKETPSITVYRNIDDFMNCYANSKDLIFGPYRNRFLVGYEELKVEAENVIKNNPNPSLNTYEYSNWNIKINGDNAFVSCILTTNMPNGSKTEHYKSDYLQKMGGQWKILDHRFYNKPNAVEEDEAAIKSTIEGETNAFKLNDESKTTGYWLNAPYTSHSYTAKGVGYVRGSKVGETITNYLKSNPKIDKSPTNYHDYIIRINGNSAWATWIADGTSNGKKVSYYKGSYLEKVNGEWKIGSINSVDAK